MSEYIKIAAAVVLPHFGGYYGSTIIRKEKGWYKELQKPPWTPPNWLLGPMWVSLYTAMGYASYLTWKDGGGFEGAMAPLSAYGLSLALNWMWIPVFFGRHLLGPSVAIILSYFGVTCATTYLYWSINKSASYLMFPLIGWTALAASLNVYIWLNNKDKGN